MIQSRECKKALFLRKKKVEKKVLVSLDTYNRLEGYLDCVGILRKERRMFEYAKAGYSYQDSLQQVSYEMKHNRASITSHYLGG
jgi:hypothetical protein